MNFFSRKTHPEVVKQAKQAEELKASIIKPSKKVEKEVDKLNKLIRSNGFSLKISVGLGGRHG